MTGTYFDEDTQKYEIDNFVQYDIFYDAFRSTFCAAWLGVMIAVGFAFFTLSTSKQKKTKIFQIQLISVILAILYNAIEIGRSIYGSMFTWYKEDQRLNYLLYSILESIGHTFDHLVPLFADSSLLFRLSTFFPYPIFSKKVRFYILSPFVFVIIIRFLLSILLGLDQLYQSLYGVQWVETDPFPQSPKPDWTDAVYSLSSTIENCLGSLHSIVVSSILLYKAHKLSKDRITNITNKKQIRSRLRFFSEALTMCFVPPIFLNIAAAIQLNGPWDYYVYFRETQALNVNLSVIFSILASSWNSIRVQQSFSNKESEMKDTTISLQPME